MLKRGRKRIALFKLYLEYAFQKSSIIIMLLAFIVTGFCLYYLVDGLDPVMYLEGYDSLHNEYLKDAITIVQILNSVIATALVIILAYQARDFDKLYITVFKRETIIVVKFIVLICIIILAAIIEWLIIMMIAYFKFERFYISYDRLIEIIYIFLPALLDASLGFLITILFPIIFSPFLVLVASIILKFTCYSSKSIATLISSCLPILDVENSFIIYNNYIYAIGIIIFSLTLATSIYSIRDIK